MLGMCPCLKERLLDSAVYSQVLVGCDTICMACCLPLYTDEGYMLWVCEEYLYREIISRKLFIEY